MEIFLQGLTMGLAYVAPIGLQNLFVINTALTETKGRAILTAWIVVFFDVTLALACFFVIGFIMEKYRFLQMVILFFGSLIVIWIGIGLLRAKAQEISGENTTRSLLKKISTACVVTWFNPQAIIDGTMMLGAFRATLAATEMMPFIGGVTSASCLWFTAVTLIVALFRERFNSKVLRAINIICGIVIITYGLKLLWNFIEMIS